MTGSSPEHEHPTGRGPGRPRDDDIDDRILSATLAIIDEGGVPTVSRVVERCGVSRAALYRRWASITSLVAASLDVGRSAPPEVDGTDPREKILLSLVEMTSDGATVSGYTEDRLRQRIRLTMNDPELQRAYWTSHVARRRVGVAEVIRDGMAQGVLRPDLDVDACQDLLAGIFYYQVVVRGDAVDHPAVQARCRHALDVGLRGMYVDPTF
ncbi:MAG: TetR/AcrR family transcriptional regulator [Dietzia sp.]